MGKQEFDASANDIKHCFFNIDRECKILKATIKKNDHEEDYKFNTQLLDREVRILQANLNVILKEAKSAMVEIETIKSTLEVEEEVEPTVPVTQTTEAAPVPAVPAAYDPGANGETVNE